MRSLKILFLLIAFGAATLSAQTAPAAPEQVTYFLGEVKVSSPAGQPYGSSVSLIKRTLTPAENKIVELVLTIDAKHPTAEYATVFVVKDGKFTIKDEEKTFEGEGEFTGKPWNWTGWKYQVNMLGARKGVLKGDDTLTEAGLMVKKGFYSPEGQLLVNFTEDLKPVSKEMYDLLHAKFMGK